MQSDVLFSIQGKFSLTDMCHEIFGFRFFSWIVFPQAPENSIRIISQIKVHHRYQRQRNLKEKINFMLSVLSKGAQTK